MQGYLTYVITFHCIYNILNAISFLYQGYMGYMIRKNRLAGKPDFSIVKKHRRFGPILIAEFFLGFLLGILVVYTAYGDLIVYNLHFLIALTLLLGILAAFFVSRKITLKTGLLRNVHAALGAGVLILYIFQIFLGIYLRFGL